MFGGVLRGLALALAVSAATWLHARYELRTIPDGTTQMAPAVRPRSVRIFETPGTLPPRGAIAWFEHPSHRAANGGRMLLSRVVGLPGDRIAVRGGRTARNGKPVAEDHVERRVELEDLEEIVVPDGHVYLLNDARGEPGSPAADSRRLGAVPAALIVGWLEDRVAARAAAGGAR